MNRTSLAAVMFGCMLSQPAFATEAETIGWEDLTPGIVVDIPNPFEKLSSKKLSILAKILDLESSASGDIDPDVRGEASKLRSQLAQEGLDVDALFEARLQIIEARMQAATAVSETVIGKAVRLPGYLLPLEFDGQRAVEFLLVPYVGACIHTPPPPANQIVHVVYPEGFEAQSLYTPVWITGELTTETSVQNLSFVDGQAAIAVGYAMHPDSVLKYQE